MAEKEFTLKVIKSEPTPRRRRVAPGANGDAMNRVSTREMKTTCHYIQISAGLGGRRPCGAFTCQAAGVLCR